MWKAVLSSLFAALLVLPGCNGELPDLPDGDGDGIPDIIDPCPDDPDPLCGVNPPAGGAYDCEDPPALAGFVPVKNPKLDQVLVVLRPRLTGFGTESLMQAVVSRVPQLSGLETLVNLGMFAGELDSAAVAAVLADPDVAYVQQVGTKTAIELWNLDRIDQRPKALDGTYDPEGTGAGVNVYIVDTGISEHPDFEDRLQEPCFTAHTFGGCSDMHGHGTHVAGSAAGKTFGVAKKASLYAVRVLDANGSGSDTDVIRGIEWVVERHKTLGAPSIINMSLGGSPAPALDDAVCKAIAAGVSNVVAAGNDSSDAYSSSPSRVKQAVTVGAMEEGDRAAYFSNHGPGVDLYAPGVDIRSAKPGGGTDIMRGTSMASPHVAGAAALIAADRTPAEIEAELVAGATVDALSSVPAETANRLLYVGKAQAPEDNCPFNGSPPGEPTWPWCKDVGQQCSSQESPCKTNPSTDPTYCEEAVKCPTPPPPPPPATGPCVPEKDLVAVDDRAPIYHDVVERATDTLGDLRNVSEDKALEAVAVEVRKIIHQCVVVGVEAIFMVRPDKTWEENHIVAFDDAPNHNAGWTNNGRGKYKGVHTSGPMPDGLLPDPRDYDDDAEYRLRKWQGKWDRTLTLMRVLEYCEAIGMGEMGGLPRASCPVRPESHDYRIWWEQLFGYHWECNGIVLEPCGETRNPNCVTTNPAQAHCTGHVKTCDAARVICSEADW